MSTDKVVVELIRAFIKSLDKTQLESFKILLSLEDPDVISKLVSEVRHG